MVAEHEGEGCF